MIDLLICEFKSGKISMDSNIGRNLVRIIDSIPVLDVETFDTLMTNQMNVRSLFLIFFALMK